jgi:hypothetical protein
MYRLKILFEFAMKPVYFLNSKFTVIYTQEYSHNITEIQDSHSQHREIQ